MNAQAAEQAAGDDQSPQLDAAQIAMLRTLRGGALLPQLIKTWSTQAPKQLQDMKSAMERQDLTLISTIAHALKSASYSIGAKFVGEACGLLEAAARNGESQNAAVHFSTLQECISRLQPELEQYL